MPEFKLILKEKEIISGTICCRFEKPSWFDFKPGQFISLIFDEMPYTDQKGNRRNMSIASSPTEPLIHISMRLGTSAYKRSLKHCQPGDQFTALGPFGKFGMPDDSTMPIVFLAGGIGVTPFRSMIKYCIDKKISRDISLLYINSSLNEAIYLEELQKWANEHKFIDFIPVIKNVDLKWKGATGLINTELLKNNLGDIKSPTYLIVGPPGMVMAMVNMLQELKISDNQIITEKFTGYQ